jgi:hypothetical protein
VKGCLVTDCTEKHHAKGYCRKHYRSAHVISHHDSFARSSASRAWQAARDANARVEELLARLEAIETPAPKPRLSQLYRCGWCGAWATAPACPTHIDLMDTATLLEEALGA